MSAQATMEERLRRQIEAAPWAEYHVIVRTDEAATLAAQCQREGIAVHHRFTLLPGLALTATGEALMMLAQHPHVRRIERDREIRAL